MGGSDIILNLAYISLFASTFSRSIVWLRAALIAAAIAFIIYGSVTGIVSMVVWNVIIGSLHCFQQYKHVRARSQVVIEASDERFRQLLFPNLSEFDFYVLWAMGEEGTMTGEQLTHEGQESDSVWLILDGVVEVRRSGESRVRLSAGSLVGEMSFVSGGPATADTIPVGKVLLRRWPASSLHTLAEVNPTAARALSDAVSQDLNRKLSWRNLWG